MKQICLAVFFISAVLVSQASLGGQSIGVTTVSPVLIEPNSGNYQTVPDQSALKLTNEAINGSRSEEVEPTSTSSTVTASGVLVAIVIGVVVGAIAAAANKPDSPPSAPTSQGTINLNR